MNYNQAVSYINSLEYLGVKLGLSRIKGLLKLAGNPEKRLRIIHVAGTNGKGSVCAMIASVLKQQGYRTGLYTSPHLVDYRERFVINGRKISEKGFAGLVERLKPLAKKTKATLFEFITAMAFLYFYEKKVDFLVLETGLGGRLDATNVAKAMISVITNVAVEHTEYLGRTIKNIAGEKAGIIKKESIVVTGAKGKALYVIRSVCKKKNAKLITVKKSKKDYKLSLNGNFQKENMNVALEAISALKRYYNIRISEKSISSGLQSVVWPARFEFVKNNLILDCAHNPSGFEALAKEIRLLKKDGYKKITFVVSIMKDKDIKSMMSKIVPVADRIIITKPEIRRAASPEQIAKNIQDNKKKKITIKRISNIKQALSYAENTAVKKELIVVAGSIYFIGEIIANV